MSKSVVRTGRSFQVKKNSATKPLPRPHIQATGEEYKARIPENICTKQIK